MRIKMNIISDTIIGSGQSVPGAEDITILVDREGFPYYKGGSLKGIFREEYSNLLYWNDCSEDEVKKELFNLLGSNGFSSDADETKLRFTNFELSEAVKNVIRKEGLSANEVNEAFTTVRTFTAIDNDNGMVKEGSLRQARCLKKGITLYGNITCSKEQEETVKEVLSLIKWIGSMRNRGFGRVGFEIVREASR
ncbi:RAMP superfamily CRISPR-associated protein [Oribacterium sp. FC2011]|uniref:RAMP superfamily CRISPR-associated protein n=1 Tax=Oribacterium sp. FC2011 TaxID=1408311 RepID=UPI0004E0B271|nr:RAMP superfamily CRISPR-associated protein [Oribacterium sp. FC2011]